MKTLAAVCLLAIACGERRPPAAPSASPLEHFVAVLRDGRSVYGLGHACDEWRAEPGTADLVLETDDDDEPAVPARETITGRLTARPDREGRVYSFTYELDLEKRPLRLAVTGRGSWQPATGVVIRRPDTATAIVGVARYCRSEAAVRVDPRGIDAVLVGDEAWYLSRDACMHATENSQFDGPRAHSALGCSP